MSSIDLHEHISNQHGNQQPSIPLPIDLASWIDPNTNADVLQSAGEAFAMDGAAVLPCAVGTLGLG